MREDGITNNQSTKTFCGSIVKGIHANSRINLILFFNNLGLCLQWIKFQLEKGENGIEHWQFYLKTWKNYRAVTLKKLLKVSDKTNHIDGVRAKDAQFIYTEDPRKVVLDGPWTYHYAEGEWEGPWDKSHYMKCGGCTEKCERMKLRYFIDKKLEEILKWQLYLDRTDPCGKLSTNVKII